MKYFNLAVGIGCGMCAGSAFVDGDYTFSGVLLFPSIVNNALFFTSEET